MKWIKASERLPEIGKLVVWRWGNISGNYVELADWVRDLHGNPCIRTDNLIDLSDSNDQYYWLDETPEDFDSLERQFNKDFGIHNKPIVGYDVIQWIKKKLDGR